MLKLICLALLVSYTAAGVVEPEICNFGYGGFINVTIEGCSGEGPCYIPRDTPIEITITFIPEIDIVGGKYLITAAYMGLNIEITNVNLCNGLDCPVEAGEVVTHIHTIIIPGSIPAISTTVTILITDFNGGPVACAVLDIKLV